MKYRIKIEQIDYDNNVVKSSQVELNEEMIKHSSHDILTMSAEQLVHRFKQQLNDTGISRVYAVTGEDHGSIIEAPNEENAREAFSRYYDGENIISVKDISDYNLENL
jgi:transcriptional regulator of NAD metabolism